MRRSRRAFTEQTDEFIGAVVRRQLSLPDLRDLLPPADEPRLREIKEDINKHRARIHRAQRDYDDEFIEGLDPKRVRDRENAAIDTLEVERLRLSLRGRTPACWEHVIQSLPSTPAILLIGGGLKTSFVRCVSTRIHVESNRSSPIR
ncbi:hypothetical protein LVY72_13960 [Arthrobacter sp. I2-34]|uniref:Uncharacterized protein n=1 Tax=Arthrobacter hankyongi TaxID=2904801 RepID=A0ABS9L8J8_9MICC|nr:hypothetical protein [Arthrobacter hankyongi]MCG2623003.1 hypothetical protein [Arthrobacter hankyongi]